MTDLESQLLEAHRRTCGDHDVSTNRCPVWNGIRTAADLALEALATDVEASCASYRRFNAEVPEGYTAVLDHIRSLRTRGGSTV